MNNLIELKKIYLHISSYEKKTKGSTFKGEMNDYYRNYISCAEDIYQLEDIIENMNNVTEEIIQEIMIKISEIVKSNEENEIIKIMKNYSSTYLIDFEILLLKIFDIFCSNDMLSFINGEPYKHFISILNRNSSKLIKIVHKYLKKKIIKENNKDKYKSYVVNALIAIIVAVLSVVITNKIIKNDLEDNVKKIEIILEKNNLK